MNKKIKNLFLAGAVLVGLAGVSVSCTDYSKDIDELRDENAELSKTVDALKAAIKAGSVITKVEETSTGLKFTLSDGTTYTVTNGTAGVDGKDGADGTNGKDGADGKTPYIGEDGYWYIGETNTGVKATGANGKDGSYKYYVPVNGEWIEYSTENPNGKATGLSCLPSQSVTATLSSDGKTLTLAITDASGNISKTTIDLGGTVSSLVFIPQVYVDGVEGILYPALYYNAYTIKASNLDTEGEVWTAEDGQEEYDAKKYPYGTDKDKNGSTEYYANRVTGETIAEYHVNAKDVTLDDTFTYEFITKEVETRGDVKDFSAEAEFVSFADGVLTVKATFGGYEGYDGKIGVVALKATSADGKVTVVSGYAAVYSDEYQTLVIAKPKNGSHYKSTLGVLWETSASHDLTVAYNKSIDLKQQVAVHYDRTLDPHDTLSTDIINALGLTWEFELVKNYKIGSPVATDQADFATLTDGVLTPKVYATDGTASIGRTPIVRVKLMDGENVVSVAYIKVLIGAVDKTSTIELAGKVDGKGNAKTAFVFTTSDKIYTTVEDMNTLLYNKVGFSKDQFHAIYGNIEPYPGVNNIGTVEFVEVSGSTGTYVIEWAVTAQDLYKAYTAAKSAGTTLESVTYKGYVENRNNTNDKVLINLTVNVDLTTLGYLDGYNLPEAVYIPGYWDSGVTSFSFKTPASSRGSSIDDKYLQVDLNSLFKKNESGLIDIPEIFQTAATGYNIDYTFCNEMVYAADGKTKAKRTIGGITVQFTIQVINDGPNTGNFILWAQEYDVKNKRFVGDNVQIAHIYNNGGNPKYYFSYLNKNDNNGDIELAQKLLNTGEMYVLIGAKTYLSGVESTVVPIKFNGEDCFRAKIVPPVTVAVADNEITAASPYLYKKGLVTLNDKDGKIADANLSYYGVSNTEWFNLGAATCDITGATKTLDVSNITFTKYMALPGDGTSTDAAGNIYEKGKFYLFGYNENITNGGNTPLGTVDADGEYWNFKYSGNVDYHGEFHIYIPVKVSTTWGTIEKTVTITVKQ